MPFSGRIAEHFGRAVVHHHALGLQVQGVIGKAVQGSLIQISTDPNCPPPIDSIRALYEQSRDNSLMIDATPEQIEDHISELAQVCAVIVTETPDPAIAKRTVDLVRSNSNPQ